MKILARCTSAVCPVTWAHLLNKEGLGDQLKDALSHQLDSTVRILVVDPATTQPVQWLTTTQPVSAGFGDEGGGPRAAEMRQCHRLLCQCFFACLAGARG